LYEKDPYFASLMAVEESNVAIRLASVDEARSRCLDRLEHSHKTIVDRETRKARWTAPKIGDLVLLCNMALDGQHGHKLRARWEGPYLLDDIHENGRAGRLRDIHSGALVKIKASGAKERVTVHLDDLKVFVPRADSEVVNSVNSVCLRDWAPDVMNSPPIATDPSTRTPPLNGATAPPQATTPVPLRKSIDGTVVNVEGVVRIFRLLFILVIFSEVERFF
jgi:hypothetical protein